MEFSGCSALRSGSVWIRAQSWQHKSVYVGEFIMPICHFGSVLMGGGFADEWAKGVDSLPALINKGIKWNKVNKVIYSHP